MSSRGRASTAVSGIAATACIVLAAASVLAVVVVYSVGIRPAQALPSYARQTGQQCAACHNGFPELTPYGRQFKLNGYVWSGGTWNLPPIAVELLSPTFTNVRKGMAGGLAPGFGFNNDFAFTGSLFYGGKIFDSLGAFAQVRYDNVPNTIHWDNIDIRYATRSEFFRARGGLRRERQQQPDGERCLDTRHRPLATPISPPSWRRFLAP
jgi:hypothetical protein